MLNISGIQAFLIGLAGLFIIFVGISIVSKSKKAAMSEVAQTSINAIIGIVFIVIGATAGLAVAIGGDVLKLLRGE